MLNQLKLLQHSVII